jgi:uncharacterized DUF497 family protein
MRFDWDAQKAHRILEARGIDFRDMVQIFASDRVEIRSKHPGEERWLAIGELNGKCFTVVYTMREGTIRIITARRARPDEERAYHSRHP